MAVRRELVIDECGGATRRRRQAHAKNRPECNRTNDELKPPFPNGRHKKNTQRQKCPPRKGVRADPLADRLFPRGGRAFVAGLRYVLFVIPPLSLRYCA